MAARPPRPQHSCTISSSGSTDDFVAERVLDSAVGPLVLIGLGGTGRGEMAPFSDLDLMFLTAKAPTSHQERLSEAMLHILWDLNVKVGHSRRSTRRDRLRWRRPT